MTKYLIIFQLIKNQQLIDWISKWLMRAVGWLTHELIERISILTWTLPIFLYWSFLGVPNFRVVALRAAGKADPHLPHVLPLKEQEVTCPTRDATVGSRTLKTFFRTAVVVVVVVARDFLLLRFDLSEWGLNPAEVRVLGVVLHSRWRYKYGDEDGGSDDDGQVEWHGWE